ncbi:uncharacterized protein LOC114701776 isoform X2 [Peromyscus leucopus]|uniref:uncharacterized protein LOC114701776 isoform X2 n=1 Tax=Peromyscus leucopus TaxID=10041 RepID=UPI00188533A9|nr:uncharacterized protein LOC114701776 isoform X2 [Peromyscus leucopus]
MSNAPTNSGGGHVARRSSVSRDRPRQSLLPRQACGFGIGGERRARGPQRHLVPGAWALLQRATRPRTSRPLRRRPLLLFYPCRKGRGTPQNNASQSGITLESWTQPSRVPLRSTRRTAPRSRTRASGKPGKRNRPRAGARARWLDVTRKPPVSGRDAGASLALFGWREQESWLPAERQDVTLPRIDLAVFSIVREWKKLGMKI